MQRNEILALHGISKRYRLNWTLRPSSTLWLPALNDINLTLKDRETVCLVGESGCGKSTLAQIVAKLAEPDMGRMLLDGRDVTALSGQTLKDFRRQVQVVFQDPYSSLNPRFTLRDIVSEPLKNFTDMTARQRDARCGELLQRVGLSKADLDRYPAQLSGGQRQRVAIARAIAASPRIVIADEAVSALDVSVKAQILNLLMDLQQEFGMSYLFITHDVGVVEQIADRVVVMYLGRIVEMGEAAEVLRNPRHPYTRMLLNAVPRVSLDHRKQFESAFGDLPSAIKPPSGCVFRTRCPDATEVCATDAPHLHDAGHACSVSCHHPCGTH